MLGAFFNRLLGPLFDFPTSRMRDHEQTRPRVEPFDDPGGYRAYGDYPLVPSDLKVSRFHAATNNLGESNRGA